MNREGSPRIPQQELLPGRILYRVAQSEFYAIREILIIFQSQCDYHLVSTCATADFLREIWLSCGVVKVDLGVTSDTRHFMIFEEARTLPSHGINTHHRTHSARAHLQRACCMPAICWCAEYHIPTGERRQCATLP